MVFHDYGLHRLTAAAGTVAQLSADQLGAIQLSGGNEGIPDLAEILDLVAGKAPLLIEFKDQDGAMGTNVGPLEKAAADLLSKYSGPVAVMSFNPNSVACLTEFLPDVARGLVTSAYTSDDWPLSQVVCDHLRKIPDYDRVGASFISHELADLGRARC